MTKTTAQRAKEFDPKGDNVSSSNNDNFLQNVPSPGFGENLSNIGLQKFVLSDLMPDSLNQILIISQTDQDIELQHSVDLLETSTNPDSNFQYKFQNGITVISNKALILVRN